MLETITSLWQAGPMSVGKPKVVVVLGPWSSGTSAVAGVVAALGAAAHPPFGRVADPSTPVSFESGSLREIVVGAFNHEDLTRGSLPTGAISRLGEWAGTAALSVAKMPMLCWFVPEMVEAWDACFIVVHRDLAAIEATRVRRDWPDEYGAKGAEVVYPLIERDLPSEAPRLDIDYATLLEDPAGAGVRIAEFCGLTPDTEAVRWVLSRGREGTQPASFSG